MTAHAINANAIVTATAYSIVYITHAIILQDTTDYMPRNTDVENSRLSPASNFQNTPAKNIISANIAIAAIAPVIIRDFITL